MSDAVLIEDVGDGIIVLKMNRPEKANASDNILCNAISQAIRNLNQDPNTKVIILTGVGKAFAAGGDVKAMHTKTDMFAGSPDDIRNQYRSVIHQLQLAIYDSEVPIIAAVNGAAAGAGNDLVAVCDLAIASENAKFAETFVTIGLISGDGGSWLLPRVIGKRNAYLMAFTGEWFSADDVLKMGLVSKVVPHEKLLEEATLIAKQIAKNPTRAVRATRRLLVEGEESSFRAALDTCASIQGGLHFSKEHNEKLNELIEKLNRKHG